MAYRFILDEPFSDGIRRISTGQIRRIGRELSSKTDVHAGIHQSRKCLKRLRALFVLLEGMVPETAWRRETGRYRSIARSLAGARDLHAMLETLARLRARFGAAALGPYVVTFEAEIRRRLDSIEQSSADGAVEFARREIERAARGLKRLKIGSVDLDRMVAAVTTTYGAARDTRTRAYRTGIDEDFHEWRKHVQRHWRHMQLFLPAWPEELTVRVQLASRLSEVLGDDHDLWMLINLIELERAAERAGKREVRELSEFCHRRQAELRQEARALGKRLLAERPTAFARRLAAYWRSAGDLAALGAEMRASAGAATGPVETGAKASEAAGLH
jgi:CHAD domain-containing protein